MITERNISSTGSIGLRAKRNMPNFKNQSTKKCNIVKMTGRIYKEGREMRDGKSVWVDLLGEPDNRLMVFAALAGGPDLFYKVFKDMGEVNEHFEIIES